MIKVIIMILTGLICGIGLVYIAGSVVALYTLLVCLFLVIIGVLEIVYN